MDLAEAPRILGGGAGLDGADASRLLADVAVALGASIGRHPRRHRPRAGSATSARSARPAWSSTPGSTWPSASAGAVQHTSGLGRPDHICQREHRPALPDDAARRPAPSWPTPTPCSTSWRRPGCARRLGGRMAPMPDVDVVVVGAGPAGSAAALALARAGRTVLPRRAGPVPRVPRTCTAAWSTAASSTRCSRAGGRRRPIQRWVTRRVHHADDGHAGAHRRLPHRRPGAEPPYNGATTYRPDFDSWLAGKAEAAGADAGLRPPPSTGLLRDGRRRGRRRAHRPARRRPHRRAS